MPRALMFILILLICNCTAIAQDKPTTITNKWQQTGTDTATLREAIDAARDNLDKQPEAAMKMLEALLKQSHRIGYKRGINQCYYYIAWAYHAQGKNEKTVEILKQLIPYTLMPENIEKANSTYRLLGAAYSHLGQNDESLKCYDTALQLLKGRAIPIGKPDSSNVYAALCWSWEQLGEGKYATELAHKGIEIAKRRKNYQSLSQLYNLLGSSSEQSNQLDTAEKYFKLSLQIARTYPGAKSSERHNLLGLARVAEDKGEYEKALRYLDESYATAEKSVQQLAEMNTESERAAVYYAMKKYDKAYRIMMPMLEKAYERKQKDLLNRIEQIAAHICAATGRYKEACDILKRHQEAKAERFTEAKDRFLEAVSKARTAEKDRQLLAQKLIIRKQDSQLQRTNFWMGISVMGTLLLFSVSFAVVRNYRNKQTLQQAQIAQLQQSKEINHLKARMRGEEQERERIARDLHDSIASQLWAIRLKIESMQLKTAAPATGRREKLSTVFYQLNEVTQNVRKTAHNLLPDLLLQEGLATALASFCDRLGKTQKKQIDFQEYGHVPAIDKEIELTIYRIVQELVQHIIQKTKRERPLLVQLSCINDLLSFSIEGEDAENTAPAVNTLNTEQLREKISAIKGNLELQSEPGKPAYAYLEFDLKGFIA